MFSESLVKKPLEGGIFSQSLWNFAKTLLKKDACFYITVFVEIWSRSVLWLFLYPLGSRESLSKCAWRARV